jgi:hypothetical protein
MDVGEPLRVVLPFITRHVNHRPVSVPSSASGRAVEILLSDFQEPRMSDLIQGVGFTVEPLGQIPMLVSEGFEAADWTEGNVFFSSRVTIEVTGEKQIFQLHPVLGDQSTVNLVAMEYGNKRAGNTV